MKIEEFSNVKIAYMRNIGEYGHQNHVLMENLKQVLRENNLMNESTVIVAIALDNPEFIKSEELRYDVGLVITEDIAVEQLDKRILADGKYAIFEVEHTVEAVGNFWKSIPKKSEDLSIDANKPIIERYSIEKVKKHLCEFCIPLRE